MKKAPEEIDLENETIKDNSIQFNHLNTFGIEGIKDEDIKKIIFKPHSHPKKHYSHVLYEGALYSKSLGEREKYVKQEENFCEQNKKSLINKLFNSQKNPKL